MNRTVVIDNLINKLKSFVKTVSSILTIALAMVAGFFIGYYYWIMIAAKKESPLNHTRHLSTTSIAINERNELLIIDRANGVYRVYQDSIGIAIFNMYANTKYEQTVK